jgi:hypothetical protein
MHYDTLRISSLLFSVVPDPNISAYDTNDVSGARYLWRYEFHRISLVHTWHMMNVVVVDGSGRIIEGWWNSNRVHGLKTHGLCLSKGRLSLAETLANRGNLFRGLDHTDRRRVGKHP